jgi:hypothetical protein
MNIKFDLECTPEEARRLMGLPDLTPVHKIYIEKLSEAAHAGGLSTDALTGIVQQWGPMSELNAKFFKAVFGDKG